MRTEPEVSNEPVALVYNLRYKPKEFNLRLEGVETICYCQVMDWSDPYWKTLLRAMEVLYDRSRGAGRRRAL